MKAIYAAKLYRASSRKQQIQSALEDPKNKELVKQLARYLDEEYLPTEVEYGAAELNNPNDSVSPDNSASTSGPSPSGSAPSHSGGGGSVGLGDIEDIDLPGGEGDDATEGDVDSGADSSAVDDSSTQPEPETDTDTEDIEPVEESTKHPSSKTSVTASTDVSALPEELKGTLNARQECCGVNRVMVKDNELWIHYNDDINLNNVMTPVIELFNAAGYTYLEFNRLARSANAIVFVSNMLDTNNNVKPVEEVDDQE